MNSFANYFTDSLFSLSPSRSPLGQNARTNCPNHQNSHDNSNHNSRNRTSSSNGAASNSNGATATTTTTTSATGSGQPMVSSMAGCSSGSGSSNGLEDRLRRQSRQMSLGANIHPDDAFFDLLIRCQSSRLEDQRTTLPALFGSTASGASSSNTSGTSSVSASGSVARASSSSARTSATAAPSLSHHNNTTNNNPSNNLATNNNNNNSNTGASDSSTSGAHRGSNLPEDEDFYSLLMNFQSARIEDQRSSLPANDTEAKSGRKSCANSCSSGEKVSQL